MTDPGRRRDGAGRNNASLLHRFGGDPFHMIQSHRAVGGGGGAEILQIGFGALVKAAQPFIKPHDIGNVLHDLHADGGTEKLRLILILFCVHEVVEYNVL